MANQHTISNGRLRYIQTSFVLWLKLRACSEESQLPNLREIPSDVVHHLKNVTGEFPAQRRVTWSFDVFFDLHPNKRLSKQSYGWWFETLSRPLWRYQQSIFDAQLIEIVRPG